MIQQYEHSRFAHCTCTVIKITSDCLSIDLPVFPSELPEKAERIRAVYQKIDELPPANYNTLERLIYHLVR